MQRKLICVLTIPSTITINNVCQHIILDLQMAYFHYRCGERITLLNDNCTAVRNDSDFDNGLVITAEPLVNDVLFEIKIDRKVNSWSGSLEIGVVDCDPLHFNFPPCSSKIQAESWIMSAASFFKNGNCMIERYGSDLDKLNQDDRVGLMRTAEGDLIFFINGESQGVAAENLPASVHAIVDVYGKCVQISITSPALREHNNDDCLSGSSVLAIDNDILNVTLGGDLSELSMSSSNSLDIRMDMNVSLSLPEECPRQDKIRFHDRCGSLVKLSNGNRTAERRRPLDEFNNGVVMTHRPLRDSELFEIRIDRLVDKWSGSIEMGITTHNPTTLVFPATMTNMRSGTIMMSGCGILTNGKGTRREYGDFNLDELSEGDRVGMMRKPDGNLHYFINGLDQGVAAQRVPTTVWGVIDLYGMTIKVSIVERDEREEQNLMTRKNTRDQQLVAFDPQPLPDYYDRLTFHRNCGTHAQVINNGRTAHRPNAADDFNNGVVLTARPLKTGELFEVRLDRVVTKWAGSIEIGVTAHSPVDLEFPFTMTNVRSGTWMMTGSGIMHNGTIILDQYGVNLDRLQVGDRVGVVRKENGLLHFFVNGVDQGVAASAVPEKIYGVIDLYGQAVEASIIDMYDYGSPDTLNSSLSNTTLYSDLRFHHVHGKNARIVNSGLTALRPRPLAEFNDAIVFSSRPLRDGELFEVVLDNIVDRWSGSIELASNAYVAPTPYIHKSAVSSQYSTDGVTAVRPDDIELPSTATDLCRDTWMLSGSSVMENGKTIKNHYPCDLDTLGAGVRLGVCRSPDKTLEFYRDGLPQGPACTVPNGNIYAVIDLYGQCAQVSIPCVSPLSAVVPSSQQQQQQTRTAFAAADNNNIVGGGIHGYETSLSLQIVNMALATTPLLSSQQQHQQQLSSNTVSAARTDVHLFSEFHGKSVQLSDAGRLAKRGRDVTSAVVYSATPLVKGELHEIAVVSLVGHLAGGLAIGVTETAPALMSACGNNGNAATTANEMPTDCFVLIGNELRYKNKVVQLFTPSLHWLNVGDRIGILCGQDGNTKVFINGEEISLSIPPTPNTVYLAVDLRGSCSSVALTSHKAPFSPATATMNSVKLQDSLEIVDSDAILNAAGDHMKIKSDVEASSNETSLEDTIFRSCSYEFHENHGRNVELTDGKTVARRVASYNQGVVIVQPALEVGAKVQIVVDQLEPRWQSSVIVGLVTGPPERLSLPMNALAFKAPCCIVANDWISINGVKSRSNYGQKLENITVGSTLGVALTPIGLKLVVNQVEEDVLPFVFQAGQPVHAIFDLYGQCQQIKILNEPAPTNQESPQQQEPPATTGVVAAAECDEKADLESCEKERSEMRLSLPIVVATAASTSSTTISSSTSFVVGTPAAAVITAAPTAAAPRIITSPLLTPSSAASVTCAHKDECVKFKKKLLLPDNYFTLEEPVCYCSNCHKMKSQAQEKDSPFSGWVRFPLRNSASNTSTEKWHTAFYPTKIGAIRCILDKGQPLTKGQAQWGSLIVQKEDDVQVVFYPSLQHCTSAGFKLKDNKKVLAAFQLLVKPSAYSVSRDPPEWSTKETGAIALHSLLIQLTPS